MARPPAVQKLVPRLSCAVHVCPFASGFAPRQWPLCEWHAQPPRVNEGGHVTDTVVVLTSYVRSEWTGRMSASDPVGEQMAWARTPEPRGVLPA